MHARSAVLTFPNELGAMGSPASLKRRLSRSWSVPASTLVRGVVNVPRAELYGNAVPPSAGKGSRMKGVTGAAAVGATRMSAV